MSYKCLDCGHIFDEGEQEEFCERHGFNDGRYERFSGCPICYGNYEETVECLLCGSEHTEDELTGGICEECIYNSRMDFEGWLKVSEGRKTKIELNDLLCCIFTPSEIEDILIKYIRDRGSEVDCTKFIDGEPDVLCEYYAKGGEEE